MTESAERAALLLLLRHGRHRPNHYADLVEDAGCAVPLLSEEFGLLAPEYLEKAAADVDRWRRSGLQLHTVLDASYPENLRSVHDRPPFVFVAGELTVRDQRSVAVVGTRRASPAGLAASREIATHLSERGFTVVSGLAAGIDTSAHSAALEGGGRTVAVLGTGIERCYPPENAALQGRIARECAVVSQFLPDAAPSKRSFPARNAVMSGLSLATVIVEASETSGARTQARLALAHGRPVILLSSLLEQRWGRELAARPGTYVARTPADVTQVVERLSAVDVLTA